MVLNNTGSVGDVPALLIFGGGCMATNNDKYLYSKGTHYIANSGSDENGKYTSGQAGDQTGKEAQLKAWYNRPWTVVLRFPDQGVALTIAVLSIAMCLNDKVGYDQGERGTYWKQLKAAGFDPSAIKIACEEDCTAGVSANVKAAGHIHGLAAVESLPLCTSRNMLAQFTHVGFVALTDKKYLTSPKYLLPGDILLYENHHAACNITCGANVLDWWNPMPAPAADQEEPEEPYEENVEEIEPPYVLITGSVNIRRTPSTDLTSLGIARAGEKLPYFGFRIDKWLLVLWENHTAWVSEKFGKLVV